MAKALLGDVTQGKGDARPSGAWQCKGGATRSPAQHSKGDAMYRTAPHRNGTARKTFTKGAIMAVSGSAISAYTYIPRGDVVSIKPTTILRSLCDSPAMAVLKIMGGESATVAGNDAPEVRRLLAEKGKAVRV